MLTKFRESEQSEMDLAYLLNPSSSHSGSFPRGGHVSLVTADAQLRIYFCPYP